MERVAEGVMMSFIFGVIVAGLFGPWLISLFLTAVCGGCWYAGRPSRSRGDRELVG